MPAELKTDWKRIGRSGPTVDGRSIEPESLRQAAESYDPTLFTALIWPEHFRWYNLGKITELRSENNDEGGVDLFALIAPNDYYLEAVKYGQKLFTSMELLPNFRDTGKAYLTGCAATDNPASAATSEMRFSASKEPALLLASHSELTAHDFGDNTDTNDEETKLLQRIANFFSKNTEDDMDTQLLKQLQTELAALSKKFTSLQAGDADNNDGDADKDDGKQDYAALADSVQALTDKFTAMEEKLDKSGEDDDGEGNASDLKFTALQTALDELTKKFTAALKEQPTTDADENTGGNDLEQYI